MSISLFNTLVTSWLALAAATFVVLFFVPAPYGRHVRSGWGPSLPNKWGWFLMEAPSALLFAAAFVFGRAPHNLVAWVYFLLWEAHYIHRAFIYPFMLRDAGRRMPVAVMGMAVVFNLINAGTNGYYVFTLSGGYPTAWLAGPRFIAGAILFVAGFVANRWADARLRSLRGGGVAGYQVPQGGLYRFVSSPNYLGEIVEWFGWAIATWSLAGFAFAAWTVANLAPRARANHQWYRRTFSGYPPERKALLPFIW